MIHVIATVELRPGTRDAFLREFQANLKNVRGEAGCIEYGPAIDVAPIHPKQIGPRPNHVVIIEKWVDAAALQAHFIAPHMAPYRERVKDFVVGTELQILEPR